MTFVRTVYARFREQSKSDEICNSDKNSGIWSLKPQKHAPWVRLPILQNVRHDFAFIPKCLRRFTM